MKKTGVIEMFTSIQGEGKYVGVPSIFIRFTGCNLKCCFGDSICDTSYTSYYKEESKYTEEEILQYILSSKVKHIVITGGEPLLYSEYLSKLLIDIDDNRVITIETNGTLPPLDVNLKTSHLFYSISPKLSTSVATPHQTVNVPSFGEYVFSPKEIDRINSIRINIPALSQLTRANDYQLKFVYTNEKTIKEIKDILIELRKENDIPDDKIYLMPEGEVEDKLKNNRKKCAEECLNNNWNYTDRIHILIWGDKRGV